MIIVFLCMCAKSLQLCPTLCDPKDCSLPRLLCPWNSPGKNTEVDCHALLQGIFPTLGRNLHFLPQVPPDPLQCSCLENPRDGGAWWAAVYWVARSRTRLTRLGSSSTAAWEAHISLYESILNFN